MSENLLEFTDQNWDKEVLGSPVPVLVDFWAPWCGPCRQIAPTIEALAGDYAGRAKVGKVNVDDNTDVASRYGFVATEHQIEITGICAGCRAPSG